MSAMPIAITGAGMVTGVGLTAPASCAAIRGAIDNFKETRFRDEAGEWIVGSEVHLDHPWRGEAKLLRMAVCAIGECLESNPAVDPRNTPILLCLAAPGRPGRMLLNDQHFLHGLQDELDVAFDRQSRIVAAGHVSVAVALRHARQLFLDGTAKHVVLAATDSLL